MKTPTLLVLVTFVSALCAAPALAEDKRLQDAVKRLQSSNQRLSGEKAQLERDKAELEKERSGLDADLKTQRAAAARTKRELKAQQQAHTELEAKLGDAQKHEEELNAQLAALRAELEQAKTEGAQLRTRVANQEQTIGFWRTRIDACTTQNVKLIEIGSELAGRYRDKSCADAMLQAEPFTQLRRVEFENLVEEYKERLAKQRFDWMPEKEKTP
jgi:chromosome segregation ATPase